MKVMRLKEIVERLRRQHGRMAPPPARGAFELILYENVAYLVDDARRIKAWRSLKREVGTNPAAILECDAVRLAEVIKIGGMLPPMRAEKLRKSARICLESFDGDLSGVLKGPKARAALKKFPGIGNPGADKILMMTRTKPILALESNGLRTLLRMGYGTEWKVYEKTYQSVQTAIGGKTRKDYGWLNQGFLLLRKHGQDICKQSKPRCGDCRLASGCPSRIEKAGE